MQARVPYQLLDLLTETYEWYLVENQAIDMLESYFSAREATMTGEHATPQYMAKKAHELLIANLKRAETVLVEPDMCEMAKASAHELPAKVPFHQTDVLIPIAFVHLQSPIYLQDSEGLMYDVSTIAWQVIGNDLFICCFADVDSAGIESLLAEPEVRTKKEDLPNLLPMQIAFAGFGEYVFKDNPQEPHWFRPIYSLIVLMSQFVKRQRMMVPERHARKRAKRAGLEIEPTVRLVTLRRLQEAHNGDSEPGSVEWSHRWLVHGFWRNQFYPSDKTHRLIFIEEFIKGPSNKPLVIKPRAFRLSR